MTTPSVDTLWAREGGMARDCWEVGSWSAFASNCEPADRSQARVIHHGFDFRVEADQGTKRIVKTGGDR